MTTFVIYVLTKIKIIRIIQYQLTYANFNSATLWQKTNGILPQDFLLINSVQMDRVHRFCPNGQSWSTLSTFGQSSSTLSIWIEFINPVNLNRVQLYPPISPLSTRFKASIHNLADYNINYIFKTLIKRTTTLRAGIFEMVQ